MAITIATNYIENYYDFNATIAKAASESAEIDTLGLQPTALELPTGAASFEATTTLLLFKVGRTTGARDWLRDSSGTVVSVSVTANNTNGRVYLDANKFSGGWKYWSVLTISAGTTEIAQATAARTINLICGKVV